MANVSAAKLFGFAQQDLEKYNIDKLMPEVYQKHHSKIVEKAINSEPSSLNTKERFVFGKHRSGYVFPAVIQIRTMQTLKSGFQFVAMFKVDKKLLGSNTGYLLISREKKIQAVTSNIQNILNIDNKKILKMNMLGIDLLRIAPEVFELEVQQPKVVEWALPDFDAMQQKAAPKLKKGDAARRRQTLGAENFASVKAQLQTTLNLVTMGEYGEVGYFVRVQPLEEQGADRLRVKKDVKKELRQPLFQFRYNERNGKFVREIRDSADEKKPKGFDWLENRRNVQSKPVFVLTVQLWSWGTLRRSTLMRCSWR